MSKQRVGILFGGRSAEHEVSLDSGESVYHALDKEKNQAFLIYITYEGEFFLVEEDFFKDKAGGAKKLLSLCPGRKKEAFFVKETGEALPLDVLFPVLHSSYGEDGTLQGIFKFMDLPFVGPCVLSSALCMDKVATKKILRQEGVPVCASLDFEVWERDQISFSRVKEKLGLPVFVKAANLGSSLGVSKATDEESFQRALNEAFLYDTKVLIEEGLEAREVEIGVLGHGANTKVSCPGEIITDHDFYTYEAKYLETEDLRLVIPAQIPDAISSQMKTFALRAFKALGCSGLARCDFFYQSNGSLVMNEVNTIPGFTEFSMYPKLWMASGISYPDLIQRLLDFALEKNRELGRLKTTYGS